MGGPRLKKRWGQHHLLHAELCRPLVDYLDPAGRRVVEIGPGGGMLTAALLAAGGAVTALEIDPEWAFELRRRHPAATLRLVVADAVAARWRRLTAADRVAGNLPYAVATRIVRAVTRDAPPGLKAGFLVQWEVGERLTARPGEPAYGALTVLVAARAEVTLLRRVRRGSFRPPPKVDGALVGLFRRRPPLSAADLDRFDAFVRRAFAQRRKTLRNTLAGVAGRGAVDDALAAAGLAPASRAQELSLEQHLALFAALGGA